MQEKEVLALKNLQARAKSHFSCSHEINITFMYRYSATYTEALEIHKSPFLHNAKLKYPVVFLVFLQGGRRRQILPPSSGQAVELLHRHYGSFSSPVNLICILFVKEGQQELVSSESSV